MRQFLGIFVLLVVMPTCIYSQDATDILNKAEEKYRGKESANSEMIITIVRPKWQREISMKSWSKGTDYSLILITSPAKEKGITYLKRDKEIWNWIPNIDRTIKLPPSIMMQSWMGTDFTNDDLVRESSIVEDYTHRLVGDTVLLDRDCWIIELIPKEETAVVWGRLKLFVDMTDYIQHRGEYYDEDDFLVNVMEAKKISNMGGQLIASIWEMVPIEKEGHKTVMEFIDIEFDQKIPLEFFTTQNMKKVK